MADHFADIHRLLQEGKKVILARIVRQEGASPRAAGTQCLILEDSSLIGTIGGGLLEYQVVEKAKAVFNKGKSCIIHFELMGTEVAKTDMLCGGTLDVYLEPIFPESTAAKNLFNRLNSLIVGGGSGILLTLVSEGIGYQEDKCRLLVAEDGSITGDIETLSKDEKLGLTKSFQIEKPALTGFGKDRPQIFAEPIGPCDTLYLFGAGHISTFLASLAKMVGFRVVVIDDRQEFANEKRFPDANEIIVLPFGEAFNRIRITASSYIAIITRGHIHDRHVLREALKRNSAYIGMIGSKRKRDMIYRSLIKDGFSREKLDQVHSPIGLDIGAETPEEIAVSVIAELISKRVLNRAAP